MLRMVECNCPGWHSAEVVGVPAWVDMDVRQKAEHLYHEHGYNEDYFEDAGWTSEEQVLRAWETGFLSPDDYHHEDHLHSPHGGGADHHHDPERGITQQDVEEAVSSIMKSLGRATP